MESRLHVSTAEEARSDVTGIRMNCLAIDASNLTWNA